MSSASDRRLARPRDQRLDMFRGLALAMIFINHAPGSLYEHYTSRNFGFSDAAESFVLMSGIAAGLAYSPGLRQAPFCPGIAKAWARARTLYFVHLSTTLMALGIFAGGALWFGVLDMLGRNNVDVIFAQPLGAMVGLPLLTHQLGYFNILPLYALLLVVTPFLLIAARRSPAPVLFGSVLLWICAGQWHWNLPNFPTPGGWFFDPFSWQLIFVFGLLSGAAMRAGRALVPFDHLLFWPALALVIFIGFWMQIDWLGAFGRDNLLAPLSRAGFPDYFVWFDKTYLPAPRLLHALALAYVLSSIPFVRQIAAHWLVAPLRLMGRHGLPVFAAGSVLDMLLQTLKVVWGNDPVADAIFFSAGLFTLWLLAYLLDRTSAAKAARPATLLTTPDLVAAS